MARIKFPFPKRGEIYLVNFEPALGSEINKIRPALIIQNDIANRFSPVTIVAGVSSQFGSHIYPTDVLISADESGLDKDSVILLNQLRTVDKIRLVKKLGSAGKEIMNHVELALQASLGMV